MLGTPTEDDLAFIIDKGALDYLNSFDQVPRQNLNARYQAASPTAIDLLNQML